MTERKIDWKKAAEYGAICYVWDGDEKPEKCFVGRLENYDYKESTDNYPFSIATFEGKYYNKIKYWEHAELVLPEDVEKYVIKETYRPCKNWKEFKNYFGKIAKHKNFDVYRNIDIYNTRNNQAGDYWFEEFTLEDGSPIGVKE